jgi:hypothetical protein
MPTPPTSSTWHLELRPSISRLNKLPVMTMMPTMHLSLLKRTAHPTSAPQSNPHNPHHYQPSTITRQSRHACLYGFLITRLSIFTQTSCSNLPTLMLIRTFKSQVTIRPNKSVKAGTSCWRFGPSKIVSKYYAAKPSGHSAHQASLRLVSSQHI